MDRKKFLEELKEVFQRDEDLAYDMRLEDIEEWDSLSIMATVEFLDMNFGIKTKIVDYIKMETVADLAQKAGL